MDNTEDRLLTSSSLGCVKRSNEIGGVLFILTRSKKSNKREGKFSQRQAEGQVA